MLHRDKLAFQSGVEESPSNGGKLYRSFELRKKLYSQIRSITGCDAEGIGRNESCEMKHIALVSAKKAVQKTSLEPDLIIVLILHKYRRH